MPREYKFICFEIEERKHSPNAIVGIQEVKFPLTGKVVTRRQMIVVPNVGLGKKLGDELALQLKNALEEGSIKL